MISTVVVNSDSLYTLKLALQEAVRLIDDEYDENAIMVGQTVRVEGDDFTLRVQVNDHTNYYDTCEGMGSR